MNVENVRTLIAALRSGQYRQTAGALRRDFPDGPRYCCLGVACEVAGVQPIESAIRPMLSDEDHIVRAYPDERYPAQTYLPVRVQEWLGADYHNPHVDELRDQRGRRLTLADLNDSGFTFEQIADVLDYFGVR